MQTGGDGYTWHQIDALINAAESEAETPSHDLRRNHILTLEIAGKKICVAQFNGQYFGFAQACPHAGVPLSDGWIDEKGQVVCPRHEYKFNLKNGYNISEGYFLKTYPVEIRAEGIFIRL